MEDTPDPSVAGDLARENEWTDGGRKRKRIYVEGDRLIGGVVLDLLPKFGLGPLYGRIFRNQGLKLMSATERWGRSRGIFDQQKTALKTAFLVGIAPCLPVFATAYDAFVEMVFEKVGPLFSIEGAAPPSPLGAAPPPEGGAALPPTASKGAVAP